MSSSQWLCCALSQDGNTNRIWNVPEGFREEKIFVRCFSASVTPESWNKCLSLCVGHGKHFWTNISICSKIWRLNSLFSWCTLGCFSCLSERLNRCKAGVYCFAAPPSYCCVPPILLPSATVSQMVSLRELIQPSHMCAKLNSHSYTHTHTHARMLTHSNMPDFFWLHYSLLYMKRLCVNTH